MVIEFAIRNPSTLLVKLDRVEKEISQPLVLVTPVLVVNDDGCPLKKRIARVVSS